MTFLSLLPINLISDNVLLVLSILVFFAIPISKVGYKLGVPFLLLFLVIGMMFGQDGVGISFDNFENVQFVGNVALTIILLTGGMETSFKAIKPVIKQGLVLSTAGVLLTTALTGGFIYLLSRWMPHALPFGLLGCMLLAAVMSSTDSASVFSILRGNKMKLKNNLDNILELESGSNDPMAYVLTILLVNIYGKEMTSTLPLVALLTLVMQLGIGAAVGVGMGYFTKWIAKKIRMKITMLNAIMILSLAFFTNSFAAVIKGNGLLAVYLFAIIIGNEHRLPFKKDTLKFLDGLTWLVQLLMFLMLGLLVNPTELPSVALPAILIGMFMSLVARPLSVFSLTLPFRDMTNRGRAFISWVGLKGAAPILFSIYPVVAGIPEAKEMFNIVFFITLVSLLLQGMTIPKVAKKLHVDEDSEPEVETYGIEMPDGMGTFTNHIVETADLARGNTLKDLQMPEGRRVVVIKRDEELIVPAGDVVLQPDDKLLIIEYGQKAKHS